MPLPTGTDAEQGRLKPASGFALLKILITHRYVYYTGLALMAIGIPVSVFLMSLSQFILSGYWLLSGNITEKMRSFLRNKAAVLFTSIFILHVIGVFYSFDMASAFKDLRIKLPLLILPLVISSLPRPGDRLFRLLLLAYAASVLFGSLRSVYELVAGHVSDRREISVFISHIRFSLNVCLATVILASLASLRHEFSKTQRLLMGLSALWLVVFLFILQSATGMAIILLLLALFIINYGLRRGSLMRRALFLSLAVLMLAVTGAYTVHIMKDALRADPVSHVNLPALTAEGNKYHHDTLNMQTVNGQRVWLYLSEVELRGAWNSRSNYSFDGTDRKGNKIRDILIRYLTSKGYPKDAQGTARLSNEDIRLIEDGVPDSRYPGMNPLSRRLYEFAWEYQNYRCTGNPSGHSALMRYEYWKAATGIIATHFWTGVGTGDLKTAFAQQYEIMDSSLDPKWRLRAHNQFLTIFAAFGIFGLLWFLATLILPPLILKVRRDYYFNFFLVISILSMLNEDTLETQAGVTFFAFFYVIFLFGRDRHCNAFPPPTGQKVTKS